MAKPKKYNYQKVVSQKQEPRVSYKHMMAKPRTTLSELEKVMMTVKKGESTLEKLRWFQNTCVHRRFKVVALLPTNRARRFIARCEDCGKLERTSMPNDTN